MAGGGLTHVLLSQAVITDTSSIRILSGAEFDLKMVKIGYDRDSLF